LDFFWLKFNFFKNSKNCHLSTHGSSRCKVAKKIWIFFLKIFHMLLILQFG
jgi:hypothetical protein